MMSAMSWGALSRLWLVAVVVVCIILVVWQQLRAWGTVRKLASHTRFFEQFKHFRWWRVRTLLVVYAGALLAMSIALLEPQWGEREEVVPQESRDMIFALDISRSMLASDLKPSRLEHAKMKIRALLERLVAERVGLILFSGDAFVQCPLTRDYSTFLLFLKNVTTEAFGSGTTNIERAIARGVDAFEHAGDHGTKLLIIATDGEDFSPQMRSTLERAQRIGMSIVTLGIGTPEGAPIPIYDIQGKHSGYVTDEQQKTVVSALHEDFLGQLARDSGGLYVRSYYDDSDLAQLTQYVEGRQKGRIEDRMLSIKEAQYPWFVGLAALLLGIAWIV